MKLEDLDEESKNKLKEEVLRDIKQEQKKKNNDIKKNCS